MSYDYGWIEKLPEQVNSFLKRLYKGDGYFSYSYSGDLYDKSTFWGLGNSVFAIKILYTIGKEDSPEAKAAGEYIKKFTKPDGSIYDDLIKKISLPQRILASILNLDIQRLSYKDIKIAETRQAISSLMLIGEKTSFPVKYKTKNDITKYLESFDWSKPWHSGSHFSHLLFFLNNSNLKNKKDLIKQAIIWVNSIQKDDGAWYEGKASTQQKINGAMKIITGLNAVGMVNFDKAEKLIDLCLSAKNDSHACDNFNIVYVLKYASQNTQNSYRYKEIKEFCLERLKIYKKFYYREKGGFSFLPNKANELYYGARITKGKDEPDIHGTTMFLWGISLIAQILNRDDELNFKEFKT